MTMLRSLILAAVVAVATLGALAAPATAAAPTPGCVDRAEFRAVKMGMSPDRVERVLHGLSGRVTYRSSLSLSKTYRACGSRYGFVSVDWDRYDTRTLVVGFKSAYWG